MGMLGPSNVQVTDNRLPGARWGYTGASCLCQLCPSTFAPYCPDPLQTLFLLPDKFRGAAVSSFNPAQESLFPFLSPGVLPAAGAPSSSILPGISRGVWGS